jgi:glycosyltransferase involved in cell wall biosynthesis
MRIFVFGTRGFPDIQGGVEQHCESLYPIIASNEYRITVFRRKPFVVNTSTAYSNISFIDYPSTKIPGYEALFHSFLCSITCIFKRPDIVHVHNIGPGFMIPLLKLAGLKVVLTYHSPNYEHVKWSALSKYFLRMSEYLSINFSDKIIFVSKYQMNKLGGRKNFIHINNGVKINSPAPEDDFINSQGLIKNKYILSVGRFVEEKGFDLLIRAFVRLQLKDIKLVIAGDSDHETNYSNSLKKLASENNVVLTGFVRGEKLRQLYSHARLFVLSSYNEGLPLSLLEAMSYQRPVLASNIQATLQFNLPEDCYFESGNEQSLAGSIQRKLQIEEGEAGYDMSLYDWNKVALETEEIYKELSRKF